MNYLHFRLVLISFLFLGLNSCGNLFNREPEIGSYKDLTNRFNSIITSDRPLKIWIWNSFPDETLIDEQVALFSKLAYGNLLIIPDYYAKDQYNSDEWLMTIEYAFRRAKKEGMDIFLFAGNYLVPQAKKSDFQQVKGLKLEKAYRVDQGESSMYEVISQVFRDSVVDITRDLHRIDVARGQLFLWNPVPISTEDKFALFVPGSVDSLIHLLDNCIERFDASSRKIQKIVIDDFDTSGILRNDSLVTYFPGLFDLFYERWNYRLEVHLQDLLFDTPLSKKTRYDYHRLLSELDEQGWTKLQQYAGEIHGLEIIRKNSLLASAHDSFERSIVQDESGSSCSFALKEKMIRADLGMANSQNHINFDISPLSVFGGPENEDYLPVWCQSGCETHYREINEYFARLSIALNYGSDLCNIAVIDPATSVWMLHSINGNNREERSIISSFQELVIQLKSEQIEFRVFTENDLKNNAGIVNDILYIEGHPYSTLVLPERILNLNAETADLMEAFMSAGGNVISVGQPVSYINGNPDDRCSRWNLDFSEHFYNITGNNDPRLIEYLRTDDFIILDRAGDKLIHRRFRLGDGELIYLVNSDRQEEASLRLMMKGKDMVSLDPFTGKAEQYACLVSADVISFDTKLSPASGMLLFISEDEIKSKDQRPLRWPLNPETVEPGFTSIERLDPNVLPVEMNLLVIANDTIPLVQAGKPVTELEALMNSIAGSGSMADSVRALYYFDVDSMFSFHSLSLGTEVQGNYTISLNGKELNADPEKQWLDHAIVVFGISDKLLPGSNTIEINGYTYQDDAGFAPVYLLGDFSLKEAGDGWIIGEPDTVKTVYWQFTGMPFYAGRVRYTALVNLEKSGQVKIILPAWSGIVASVMVNGNPAGNIYDSPGELRLDNFVSKGTNNISVMLYGCTENLIDKGIQAGYTYSSGTPFPNYSHYSGMDKPFLIQVDGD